MRDAICTTATACPAERTERQWDIYMARVWLQQARAWRGWPLRWCWAMQCAAQRRMQAARAETDSAQGELFGRVQ